MDKCNNHKAKTFLAVKGQCSLNMKNESEAMEKHSELKKNCNAVGPLKMMKELLCVSTEKMPTLVHDDNVE